MDNPILDFPTVCMLTGKLFLESRAEIERLSTQVKSLRGENKAQQAELAKLKHTDGTQRP